MFLALLPRATKVVTITSSSNNINLFSYASSPSFALTVICQINANVWSDILDRPAFETGTGWQQGTMIYIKNNAHIKGADNSKRGAPGMPGRGGDGGDGYDDTTFTANNGSPGGTGGNGTAGGTGGPALVVNRNTNVITLLDNQGYIFGGNGGPGGEGGKGGGGGGGGQGYTSSPPPPSDPPPESGGGGDGGGGE